MGRWDKFDKNRKTSSDPSSNLSDGMKRQLDDLLKQLEKLPEGERKEIAHKMRVVLEDALTLLNKPDTKPVSVEDVVATAILLYSEYKEFDSPSIMIAVVTKIAKDKHFNPNTYRVIAQMVSGMCDRRFS